jgi:ArsR family transcriptional regulator
MPSPNIAEINQLHTDICSALADPSRILLLYTLAESPYTVNDLAARIHASQSATSRHLKTLRERGLVNFERQGPSVLYRLADERVVTALDLLRAVLHDNLARRAAIVLEEPGREASAGPVTETVDA